MTTGFDNLIAAQQSSTLWSAYWANNYGRDTDPFANVNAAEEWDIEPWVAAMLRASDKMRRLQAYARKGSLANESVEDSLLDIAVYSGIALVLYRKASA